MQTILATVSGHKGDQLNSVEAVHCKKKQDALACTAVGGELSSAFCKRSVVHRFRGDQLSVDGATLTQQAHLYQLSGITNEWACIPVADEEVHVRRKNSNGNFAINIIVILVMSFVWRWSRDDGSPESMEHARRTAQFDFSKKQYAQSCPDIHKYTINTIHKPSVLNLCVIRWAAF